jgi:hypothetical protein
MREKDYWLDLLNKNVSISRYVGNYQQFYKGKIIDILEDKIILDDRKLGKIPLCFTGLSINEVHQ